MWVCKGVLVTVALHPPKEVAELLGQMGVLVVKECWRSRCAHTDVLWTGQAGERTVGEGGDQPDWLGKGGGHCNVTRARVVWKEEGTIDQLRVVGNAVVTAEESDL